MELNKLLNCEYDLEIIAQNNLMELLKKGISEKTITPNTVNSLGRNLIAECCIYNNVEMLEYLAKTWGEKYLFLEDKYSMNLTHFASRNGSLDILKYLQSKCALLLNEKESRFQTSALDLAIGMRQMKTIEFLIPLANQETLNCALQSTVQEGNLQIVKQLLTHGADIECRAKDIEATCLDRASYNGHYEVVAYLLEKGAQVNTFRPQDHTTPLYQACQNGHFDIVKLLLENGADPEISNLENGISPLYIASQNGYKEIIKLLVSHNVNIDTTRKDTGGTPLFFHSQEGNLDMVEFLLQNGANSNLCRVDGVSPLFMASFNGHIGVIDLLLQYGANINLPNTNGRTPLIIATCFEKEEVVKFLLSKGADKNLRDRYGYQAIDYAQQRGFQYLIQSLQ